MSNVRDILATHYPDNSGGATATAGIAYQVHWGLDHALDMHRAGQNFVVIFDYHEDVVVLNDPVDPTNICAYQVKTASNNWSINKLIKVPKAKDGKSKKSIIGKMMTLHSIFSDSISRIGFASNMYVDCVLTCGNKSDKFREFSAIQLREDELSKLVESVLKECGYAFDPKKSTFQLCFLRSDIPPDSSEDVLTGRFCKFIESMKAAYGKDIETINAISFFSSMQEMAIAKNKDKNHYDSLEKLIKYKGISRTDIDRWLSENIVRRSDADVASSVSTALMHNNTPWVKVLSIISGLQGLLANKINKDHSYIQKLPIIISRLQSENKDALQNLNVVDYARYIANKLIQSADIPPLTEDEAIGYVLYIMIKDTK